MRQSIRGLSSKRWAVLALIIALFSVSACSKKPTEPQTPQLDPVTITVPLHQTKPPSADMMAIVNRSAGAELQINWVTDEIYRDQFLNALETNSLKQVTYIGQPDYAYAKHAIRSGLFWEIGPYLGDYPNLKRLNPEILNELAVDGKIYGLYAERAPSRQGVILRKDWLDRLHLQEPGTLDELYEVMKKFTLNDPDGNGRNDTIGLVDRSDLIFGAFKTLASYFGTPNGWGLDNGGKLVPEFMTPAYMDTMNYMKRLYDEGLLGKDFTITSKQVQRYSFITGKSGVYIGNITDAPRLSDEMKKINPAAQLTLVNRVLGPRGYGVWSISSYSGLFLFSKKSISTESELKRILAVYDRMMEPETANLLQYGVPGKHYTVQDGKAAPIGSMSESRILDVLPLQQLIVANLSNPNILKLDDKAQDQMSVLADRLTEDNSRMLIRNPTEGLSSSTYDTKSMELDQIITDATYNYILGRIDASGFRRETDNWLSRGGADVIREYTAAYQGSRK